MGIKGYVWAILVILAIVIAWLGHWRDGAAYALGTALGMFLFPALIIGLVWLVASLFRVRPSGVTQRAVFLSVFGFVVLSQFAQLGAKAGRNSRSIGMEACMKAARDSAKYDIDAVLDVRKYCECALTKIAESGHMDLADLQQLRDRNSVMAHELAWPCVEAALYTSGPGTGGVRGDLERDTIVVLNTPRGIKVKVALGDGEYYFLFDSGASDIMISTGLEQDLARSGSISGYLDSLDYEMANGDIIQCRRAVVNGIRLGGFSVDSAVVAVYDGDIDYLLGKSFLDKFTSWSFIENGQKLVLVR